MGYVNFISANQLGSCKVNDSRKNLVFVCPSTVNERPESENDKVSWDQQS